MASNEELEARIADIVRGGDLQTLSLKKIRQQLEAEFSVDLTDRKKEIDAIVLRLINGDAVGNGTKETIPTASSSAPHIKAEPAVLSSADLADGNGDAGLVDMDLLDEPMSHRRPKTPKRPPPAERDHELQREEEYGRPRRAAAVAVKRSKMIESRPIKMSKSSGQGPKRAVAAGAGLTAAMMLSPQLAEFMGEGEVVKRLWEYIKEHNLQDPANKRVILCDDNLRSVFKIDRLDMFKMNKLLSKHVKRKDEVIQP